MPDVTRAPRAASPPSLVAEDAPDPAVCSDCGIETLDWWVDADELLHCDDAEACRARQVVGDRLAAYRPAAPVVELLDDVLDAAMTAHANDWHDTRLLSAVVRDTLADPAHRALVTPWLAEVGLIGGAS